MNDSKCDDGVGCTNDTCDLIDDCQFVQIQNNLFTGDFNSVAIDGAAGSSASLDYVISGNLVENRDTGFALDLDDSATGVCFDNHFFSGAGDAVTVVDFGACLNSRNFVCDALDETSIGIPKTASA